MNKTILISTLLLLSLVSCRSLIRENRSDCPAWIQVKADRTVSEQQWPYFSFRMMNPDATGVQRQVAQTTTFCSEGVTFSWTKHSPLEVVCVSNWPETIADDGNSLLIPLGQECPESLAGSVRTRTDETERYVLEIPLQSLYTTFYCEIEMKEKEIPLLPVVIATVDGYRLPDLSLHEGPYEVQAREKGRYQYTARIPRQAEPTGKGTYAGDLQLDLLTQDEETGDWILYQRLPLGELATLRGYDWSQAILDELHLHLTLDGREVVNYSIQVLEWETDVVHLNQWKQAD